MKNIFIIIALLFVLLPHSLYADKPLYKDNILIYVNDSGESRGYDLMWKAEGITGTSAEESSIPRKDGVVYVVGFRRDGYPGNVDLFALDAYTGEVIDQYTIGSSFGNPVIDGDTLYIGTGDESWNVDSQWAGDYGVYAFDISQMRDSGFSLKWFYNSGRMEPNIIIDTDRIYVSQGEGDKVLALNKNDGSVAWSFTKGNYSAVFNLMHGDYLYIANSFYGGNLLYKINKSDGTEVWHKTIAGRLWDNSITYSPDHDALFMAMYFGDASFYDITSNHIASYDMDGNERWVKSLHCPSISYTAYHDNKVFFADSCGWVYAIHPDTGDVIWERQIGKSTNAENEIDISSPVIANGNVFIGTKGEGNDTVDSRGRGAFWILDEETGEVIWTYQEDDLWDIMAVQTIVDGMMYSSTNAWDVYAFDIGDGTQQDIFTDIYDQNNTFSTETGLTQDRYVKLSCSRNGDEISCNATNFYTGPAVNVDADFKNNQVQSVLLGNGNYHIYVDGAHVYLPQISSGDTLSQIKVVAGPAYTYDTNLPLLTNISQDEVYITQAEYSPGEERVSLRIDNTHNFDADIQNFSKPFLGVESTLDNTHVHLSQQGIGGSLNTHSVDMEMHVSTGTNEVLISRWDEDAMVWTEKGSTNGLTSTHTISHLIPSRKYQLSLNGEVQFAFSDENGIISFDREIGTNLHQFILSVVKKSKTRSSVSYVCKDPQALNYSKFGRHKPSLCEYATKQDTIEETIEELQEETTEPTQDNPLGGNLCAFNLLIHDFMKKGDRNGKYSSYNRGIITEIKLLQSHINRILKEDYEGQAAGPVDGIFGPLTKRGVERLQTKLNELLKGIIAKPLIIDGIVGPFTREAINHSC